MNWKEYGAKLWWPNLRYYPGMCLKGLEKIMENVRMPRLLAEI
jgi:hypothetical protein